MLEILKQKRVRFINLTRFIGRNIQKQGGVIADRAQINVHKLFKRLLLIIFAFVEKPTGSYRNIDLGRIPDKLVGVLYCLSRAHIHNHLALTFAELLVVLLLRLFGCKFVYRIIRGYNAPLAFPAYTRLVAYPAHIGTAYIDGSSGLKLTHNLIKALPIVLLNLTVLTLSAGSVKPYTEYVAVICQKLSQLIFIVFVILVSLAVARLMPVPRRKIYSEFQAVFSTGVGNLPYDIPLAVPERT